MVVVNSRGGGGGKVKRKAIPIISTTAKLKLKAKVKEKDKNKVTPGKLKKEKELAKTKVKRKDSTTTATASDKKSDSCAKQITKKKKDEMTSAIPLPPKKVRAPKDKVVNAKPKKIAKPSAESSNKAKSKIVDSPKPKSGKDKDHTKLKSQSSSPSLASIRSGSSATATNSKKKVPISQPNTKPLPSSNSKITGPENNVVTNGPRIQAQRKFAQAGNICIGTMNFNPSMIPANSPYATPSKEITPCKRSHEGAINGSSSTAKKVKNFSPPPCKRPKTADFLTFLCVRGTPALLPEFDFFKYPQILEPEAQVPLQKKKIFVQNITHSVTEMKVKPLNIFEPDQSTSSSKINGKNKQQVAVSKVDKSLNKQLLVHSEKSALESSKKSASSSTRLLSSTPSNSFCKAENPTLGIRATASSVLFSKLRKTSTSAVTRTKPILSPPRSRLNEQDARFAMTALKLKYQRLAVNKSNRSAFLTKKAKESIILTRSKSRTSFSQGKLSPKRGKLVPRTMKPVVISPSRNAPSPDIIFGVVSSASAARKRSVKSSSSDEESESEEDEKKNISSEAESAEESNNSSSNDDESVKMGRAPSSSNEPLTRSLRNGKELARAKSRSPRPEKKNIAVARKDTDKSSKSNSPDNRRVGTRSAHRLTKSPLREIPMYKDNEPNKNLKLDKKRNKKSTKTDGKVSNNNKETVKSDKKKDDKGEKANNSNGTTSKKMDKDDGKRPSRKTKETATNLLNLLNHGFSTDDEDSGKEKHLTREDSEVGSSSSSEAHYLEKHYNAAMRREEEKFMKNKKSKSEMQRRSSTRRESVNSTSSGKSKTNQKKTAPDRKLRSKTSTSSSSNDDDGGSDEEIIRKKKAGKPTKGSSSATKSSTSRQMTPTVGDKKMPGAARKSASITCSRRRQEKSQHSSGSEKDDSSAVDDRSSSSDADDKKTSTSDEEDDERHSKVEKQPNNKKSTALRKGKSTTQKLSKKKPALLSKQSRKKIHKKSDYSGEDESQSEAESDSEDEGQGRGSEQEQDKSEEVEDSDDESVMVKPDLNKLNLKKGRKLSTPAPTNKSKMSNNKKDPITTKQEIKRERSSSLSSASGSSRRLQRQESVETEECKLSPPSRLSRSRSRSVGSDNSNFPNQLEKIEESVSGSSEEDDSDDTGVGAAEESSDSEDEDSEQPIPEKVDVSTQVDMDEVEGLPTSSVSLAELAGLVPKKEVQLPQPPPPKDDSDDDVQEIGQVFASSSTSSSLPRHRRKDKLKSSPSASAGHSTSPHGSGLPPSSSPFHHHHSTPPLHQPQPLPHFTPPTIEPIQHTPFNHFMPPPPPPIIQPDFYTPLQLVPPMVHSSIQLVGSGLGGPFSNIATNPLNTMSIPVSVPFSSHHHLLPHHHFATGSTFHATTLQTHIRSVATNLDIPLTRPMVDHHHQQHSSSFNFVGRGPSGLSSNTPLTRPPINVGMGIGGGIWGQQQQIDPNGGCGATSRNPYSAFRVPHLSSTTATHTTHTTQHVIHHQSTTVLGMNSTPVLPVSIIQPQTHQHHQQSSHHNAQSSQQGSSNYPQYQQPHTSKKNKTSSKEGNHHPNSKQKQNDSHSTSLHATTSSVPQRPKSPTPPGYHLIKHLPNVSIVPKFDRNSIQEAGSSSSSKKKLGKDSKNGANNSNDKETGEKRKVGRKKKDSAVLPHPSSPLTVRKDSSNPSTYAPKKLGKADSQCKMDSNLKIDTSILEQQSEMPSTSSSAKLSQKQHSVGRDEFGKLLKKKGPTNNKNSVSRSPTPQSSIRTNSTDIPLEQTKIESPKTHKTKHSKDEESGCSSKSHQKSSSSNASSRTSSPNVQSKCKSPECASSSSRVTSRNGLTDAPTYYPTDKEFEDPLKYIQKIQSQAEKYGMARIVPPKSFRPECNVEDDMRFTAYNHYIHKMYQRWGPNVLETECIKHNLKQSQVDVSEVPVIGGMEINMSTLYQTVKSFGGLKEVIEKQRWTKVADTMHVPKAAHDRAAKLDAIYLKYVLPYDILSDGEREKLKKKVERKWTKRRDKVLKAAENCKDEELDEDSMDELDECIVKGKTTPLSSYYRVARNTLNIFFPTEQEHSFDEIEEEYWKIVRDRDQPVCVYSGSIDCAGVGWGFPIPKASSKHPWNLKVLANNQGSILRSMGPVMGATVPTLHVAMLFTSYCWYRDPHSLPWVEYLHSGANKIWYSIAAPHESSFRSALAELMPMQCKKKQIWLASDSAMVPPEMLIAKGVPLVRAVQNPGEFLVVFPKAYTSAICTGYLISESVCFAYPSWLQSCIQTFKDINDSKEPPVFPLEKLLLSILQDARASLDVVRSILSATKQIIKEEIVLRKKVTALGVKVGGKITTESGTKNSPKKQKKAREEEIEQCYNCNYTLYLSMVRNLKTDLVMCLKHALEYFSKHKADIKKSNLLFDLDESHLDTILDNAIKRCGNVPRSPDKS